jgi:glycosyltransferase A (GT-A) superfamily protein (DUF2064 family)
MASDRRSHPTVRPHALALGVVARPGADSRLGFLGSGLAGDVASAMLLDTLGVLSTFPVKHRFFFDESAGATAKLPATWKRATLSAAGPPPARQALSHLFSLGGEAVLLVCSDTPVLPFGELFDGLLALATPKGGSQAVLVGPLESSGLFALGLTSDSPALVDGIAWSGDEARPAIERRAAEASLEVRTTSPGYVVDSVEALRRLKSEVDAGAFAPNCRKLFERPEVERVLAPAEA